MELANAIPQGAREEKTKCVLHLRGVVHALENEFQQQGGVLVREQAVDLHHQLGDAVTASFGAVCQSREISITHSSNYKKKSQSI